jgi:hypothetical protein
MEPHVTNARPEIRLNFRTLLLPLIGALMLLVAGCCGSGNSSGSPGGLANIVPGHKDAELRTRVEHDSFPTAAEAMHSPAAASGNQ